MSLRTRSKNVCCISHGKMRGFPFNLLKVKENIGQSYNLNIVSKCRVGGISLTKMLRIA